MSPTDYEITHAMIQLGGQFVASLGALYRRADEDNQRRLRDAFPEYWAQYSDLVALAAKAQQREPV